jgi:hypothetical protein
VRKGSLRAIEERKNPLQYLRQREAGQVVPQRDSGEEAGQKGCDQLPVGLECGRRDLGSPAADRTGCSVEPCDDAARQHSSRLEQILPVPARDSIPEARRAAEVEHMRLHRPKRQHAALHLRHGAHGTCHRALHLSVRHAFHRVGRWMEPDETGTENVRAAGTVRDHRDSLAATEHSGPSCAGAGPQQSGKPAGWTRTERTPRRF